MKKALALFALCGCASAVWPQPHSVSTARGAANVYTDFSFVSAVSELGSATLLRAAERYERIVGTQLSSVGVSPKLRFELSSLDEGVHSKTDYGYTVDSMGDVVVVTARSVYGAMYAMETITQLISEGNGMLPRVSIADAPQYAWRGLMVDAGRRFFPMPLIYNLLDTMSYVKMNVLHLHASDFCRFGVESKIYPNLTNALTGLQAGFYSQDDIKKMIAYAGDRGIRVVPEFDIPGHSRGFLPIESEGIKFCTDSASRRQLYNDASNSTANVLKKLFTEMSALFPDEVFNIGCDETAQTGVCLVNDTFALERVMQEFIAKDLKKHPAGWEELMFDAGAAQTTTIVDAWSRHNPGEITASGRQALASNSSHFYYTEAAPGGAAGWKKSWYDIGTTVPLAQRDLLLGGEISMWSDTYTYISQCYNPKSKPVGSALYDPKYDDEFAKSIGGMIWPRGFVAAASFWNYNASEDASSAAFVAHINGINDQVAARGGHTCPTNCSCDQLHSCGKNYIPSL